MILDKLHSRIVRRLLRKYWVRPSIDFGSAFGDLQKDFPYDLSVDGFLEHASKYSPFQKINLDEFPYPLENGKYSLITCFGTIHYLYQPDKFLSEAARISTSQAILIISWTTIKPLSNIWSFFLGINSYHKDMHKTKFDNILKLQQDWTVVETDTNISNTKHYYVLKKIK